MVIIDKILRSLFGVIDGLFAWATGVLYTLIVQIANVDIFGNYIYEFMGRIYVYLSIFMLFKLSVSVVNYVLNPDQLTDKSKGFGKLIQNVIIVIALIIMVPTIFDWAYKLQSTILNTNVLYTIVTGKKNDSNYDPTEFSNMSDEKKVEAITKESDYAGDMIKYQIMSSFIYSEDEEENQISAISSSNAECENQSSYKDKYDCLMSGDTINNTSQKKFGFTKKGFTNEYKFLISTICIGFTAYLFLVFAFDVALRCVKLGALQLIAPIPIISMLDPNSGKNGMFSKWLKECTKTYTSLFIRLIGVYFAIEIIKSMTEEGRFVWRGTETQVGFGFVKIFIILGLLMFAKQLPQFIETITGVKLDGGGLSLKKKIDSIPGKGLVAGATIGTIGAFTGAGIGRGFVGAWQGLRADMQGKSISDIRKSQVEENKKMRSAIQDGSTFGGRIQSRWSSFWGSPGTLGRIEHEEHTIDERIKDLDNQMAESKRVASQRKQLADNIGAQENRAKEKIKSGEAGALSTEYLSREAHIESLKAQMSDAVQRGLDTTALENSIAQAQVDLNDYLNNTAIYDYIDNSGDAVIANLVNDYNEIARLQGQAQHTTASARHSQMGAAKGEITAIETANRPHEDEKSRLENQKKELYDQKRTASADNNAIK